MAAFTYIAITVTYIAVTVTYIVVTVTYIVAAITNIMAAITNIVVASTYIVAATTNLPRLFFTRFHAPLPHVYHKFSERVTSAAFGVRHALRPHACRLIAPACVPRNYRVELYTEADYVCDKSRI
jgi:hypothetical protein